MIEDIYLQCIFEMLNLIWFLANQIEFTVIITADRTTVLHWGEENNSEPIHCFLFA